MAIPNNIRNLDDYLQHKGSANENPKSIGFLALIKEDFVTYERNIFDQGFWAVSVHRFGNWRMSLKPKLLRAPFTLLYRFLNKCVQVFGGIKLDYNVKVGRRVRLWHFGGMIIGAKSIGNDVQIRQNTTIGLVRTGSKGKPIIEDEVDIGAGACLLGPIIIGKGSVIGANSVVMKDIGSYSLVQGNPGKVVWKYPPKKKKEDQPKYSTTSRDDGGLL